MKKARWLIRLAMGIALLGGLTGISRADVQCPPGHENECGAKKAYYCICFNPHRTIFMGYDCWCREGQSCYPCVPVPDCNQVCGGGGGGTQGIGFFFPPW
ncbi:MAG: hypothetical protein ABIM74_04930 [candidate division WOR-3 bacterium]